MTVRPHLSAFATLCALAAAGCPAPSPGELTGTVESHTLSSQSVGDDYVLTVRVPPGYDAAGAHPVVFQLDPYLGVLQEFALTASYASQLEADGVIEPTLVVGVGYPEVPGPIEGRFRDYSLPDANGDTLGLGSGGAPAFYDFMHDELTPWLEDHYAVAGPSDRALFGHSLGGLFTMYAALQHDQDDPFVERFVVASPSFWYDSGSIFQIEQAYADEAEDLGLDLFLADGLYEGPEMTVYTDAMAERLAARGYASLSLTVQRYEVDHVRSVEPCFREGLEHHFGGAR